MLIETEARVSRIFEALCPTAGGGSGEVACDEPARSAGRS
jgi:hypothetical protein